MVPLCVYGRGGRVREERQRGEGVWVYREKDKRGSDIRARYSEGDKTEIKQR
jgi:hypothetical protein